jgi:hypothetical protein
VQYLPETTQGAVVQPIGSQGVLVVGTDTQRGISRLDQVGGVVRVLVGGPIWALVGDCRGSVGPVEGSVCGVGGALLERGRGAQWGSQRASLRACACGVQLRVLALALAVLHPGMVG